MQTLFGVRRPGRPPDSQRAVTLLRTRPRRLTAPALRHSALGSGTKTATDCPDGQLRIVFVSSEIAPWSKVGGLADVLAALPKALAARGHRVMTVAPRYAAYDDAEPTGVHVPLEFPPGLALPWPPQQQVPGAEDAAPQSAAVAAVPQGRQGEGMEVAAGPDACQPSDAAAPAAREADTGGSSPDGSPRRRRRRRRKAAAGGSSELMACSSEGPSGAAAAALGSCGAAVGQQQRQQQDGGVIQAYAEYHICREGGVDRVFVDHPLFLGAGIYGGPRGDGCSAASGVYTYTHLDPAYHPEVELQYNVLCQAALAAPLLLWDRAHAGGGGTGQAPGRAAGSGEDAAACREAGAGEPGTLQQPAAAGPLVFCANDWPTALLPLRLYHCVRTLGRSLGQGGSGSSAPPAAAQQGQQSQGQEQAGDWAQLAMDPACMQHPAGAARAVQQLYCYLLPYLQAATVAYCIHNLAYQGVLPASGLPFLSLPSGAAFGLCNGESWRGTLWYAEAQRGARQAGGDGGEGGCGSCWDSGGPAEGRGEAATGVPMGAPTQQQQQEEMAATAGRDQRHGPGEQQQEKQRRWRWKCKLREKEAVLPLPEAQQQQQGEEEAAVAGHEGSAEQAGAPPAWACCTEEAAMVAAAAAAACPSGKLNLKQGALLASDAVVTVSPSYALEVQHDPGMGCGMQDLIMARGITGIMNGIDTAEWDPATDAHLPPAARYCAATAPAGKARAKALLQERLGLRVDPSAPLVGFVGRLTEQKGVDVLLGAVPALLAPPAAPRRAPSPVPPQPLAPPPTGGSGATASAGAEPAPGGGAAREAAAVGDGMAAERQSGGAPIVGEGSEAAEAEAGEHSAQPLRRQVPLTCAGVRDSAGAADPLAPAPAPDLTNAVCPACLTVPAAGDGQERDPSGDLEMGDGAAEVAGNERPDEEQPGGGEGPAGTAGKGAGRRSPMQLVVLGTGEPWMEKALVGLERSFPGQAAGVTVFSEELAHWIVAASDYLLVPSRFEPCGLVAQCAARYGAVPIVSRVGGLKDLVTPEVGYTIRPFSFDTVAPSQRQNVKEMVQAVSAAVQDFATDAYRSRQRACMALDVSWDKPAREWEALFWDMALRRGTAAVGQGSGAARGRAEERT